MEMPPKVAIILLNWNEYQDTIECVVSLKDMEYDNYEILIVDNGSTNDSVTILQEKFPEITLIKSKENLGFCEGNNVGIRHALKNNSDYLFVLNNDTVVDRHVLEYLVKFAESNSYMCIYAPKIYFYDRPTVINSCGTTLNWLKLRPYIGECGKEDNGEFTEIVEKDIFPGAALFMKKDVIEKIGMFESGFFLIHEDTDLCLRSKNAGCKNLLVPQAVVYHKTQMSIGKHPFLTNYYSTRNFLYIARKHANLFNQFLVHLGTCIFGVKHVVKYVYGNSEEKKIARGFFEGIRDFYLGKMGKYTE